VDVGGSKIEAIAIDNDMQAVGRAVGKTDVASPERLLAAIERVVIDTLAAASSNMTDVSALGMGVPGRVNPQTGEVANAVNLNLRQTYPLGAHLAARLGRPVYLENDGRIAAFGAYHLLRREHPIQHLAYLSIGTGISAGLVLNGELYRGANGMAGEIGHVIVDPAGEPCACGLRGCLETVASGSAIARQATKHLSMSTSEAPPTAATVYQRAERGDRAATSIVHQVSQYLSRTLQWLIMAYDVEKVVIGGGVTRAGAAFLDPVFVELSRLRAQSRLADTLLLDNKFILLPVDYNPGAWGAALLARLRNATEIGRPVNMPAHM
jgi:glucokinase